MNYPTLMQRLGFRKNAHLVYNTLLSSRVPLSVSAIAKSAGIERPEVYRNLPPLLTKQFVEKIHTGKRFAYRAMDPNRLRAAFRTEVESTEHTVASLEKKTGRLLPAHIRYFKGPAGIRAVFDDVIEKTPRGATFYRYTSERDLVKVNRYLSPAYRTMRDKKKLERLVISNPLSGKQKRPRLERFIKYIPPENELFDQNIIQLIYGDYLAFINLNTEEAFIIRDTALAQFQAIIFQQLYRKL